MDLFEDRIHVASLIKALEAAWNRLDAKSYAAFFAEDADFVHVAGQRITGQAAIEDVHRRLFNTTYKGSTVAYRIEEIVRVDDQALSIRLLQSLRYMGDAERAVLNSRPTLVIASDQGYWRIVSMQNLNDAERLSPPVGVPHFRVVTGSGHSPRPPRPINPRLPPFNR